jgi:hypothetical protein
MSTPFFLQQSKDRERARFKLFCPQGHRSAALGGPPRVTLIAFICRIHRETAAGGRAGLITFLSFTFAIHP